MRWLRILLLTCMFENLSPRSWQRNVLQSVDYDCFLAKMIIAGDRRLTLPELHFTVLQCNVMPDNFDCMLAIFLPFIYLAIFWILSFLQIENCQRHTEFLAYALVANVFTTFPVFLWTEFTSDEVISSSRLSCITVGCAACLNLALWQRRATATWNTVFGTVLGRVQQNVRRRREVYCRRTISRFWFCKPHECS